MPEKPGILQRSTIMRLGRWLCRWRNARKVVLTLACVVTFIALLYAVIDWRGRHAWNRYRQQMEAKGEHLDLAAFIPKPVPDDENFAMTPFLQPLFDFKPGTQQWRDTKGLQKTRGFLSDRPQYVGGSWSMGKPTSFIPLQQHSSKPSAAGGTAAAAGPTPDRKEAAAAALEQLSKYEPVLDELRAASHRRYCRFNIFYRNEDPGGILLPHLAVIKGLSLALTLRASAELAVGRADAALSDIDLTLYLAQAIGHEPFLISHLVRLAILHLAAQPVWEGLAARQWSDAQLQGLEQRLQRFNLLADLEFTLRGERAVRNAVIQWLRRDPTRLDEIGNAPLVTPRRFTPLDLVPAGWFYWEQLHCDEAFDQVMLPGVNAAAGRVFPAKLEQAEAAFEKTLRDNWEMFVHHRLLTKMLLPVMMAVHVKFAYAQTTVDEARLACALERYRQANGRFPDHLDALAPRFIEKVPHDVITGQPLKYRLRTDGQFVLYSVGWNLKDDGGQVGLSRGSTPSLDIWTGDWVWQYPAER